MFAFNYNNRHCLLTIYTQTLKALDVTVLIEEIQSQTTLTSLIRFCLTNVDVS